MRVESFRLTAGALALAVMFSCSLALAQVAKNAGASAMDQQIASYLQKAYSGNKSLADVHPSVDDRVVTLTGSVGLLQNKLEAAHKARQVASVNGVVNQIQVNGPAVPDQQLKRDLADKLTYDRMGMGQTFNALTVKVSHGVVTVGGEVRDYPSRDSALDIIADTKGVKGMVDQIKVAPLSPMDDQIRLEAARRIYGNPSLAMYANNPAHTIRIVVTNGHVTLAGVVISQVDKSLAGNAVRTIPGVFSVQNDLVVSH
ncbi:MAG: BON domain-containing protein [Terriglobales bacterium]